MRSDARCVEPPAATYDLRYRIYDEPVAGDLDVDVFQVVRAGAAHDDPVQGHGYFASWPFPAISAAIRTAASRLAGLAVPFPAMS